MEISQCLETSETKPVRNVRDVVQDSCDKLYDSRFLACNATTIPSKSIRH